MHHWDHSFYRRHHVSLKKNADASTVGSLSQLKTYVLFDIIYDRHKLFKKKQSAWKTTSAMTPQYDLTTRLIYAFITERTLF